MSSPTPEDIELVRRFASLRSQNDPSAIDLVSDDIVRESPKGTQRGKEEVAAFFAHNKTKGGGTGEPYVEDGADCVSVNGSTKVAMLTVKIVSRFYVKDGKICRIVITKA